MSEEGSKGPLGLFKTAPELAGCGASFEFCKRQNVNKPIASHRSWQRTADAYGAVPTDLSPYHEAQETRKPLPWLRSMPDPLSTGGFEPTS